MIWFTALVIFCVQLDCSAEFMFNVNSMVGYTVLA